MFTASATIYDAIQSERLALTAAAAKVHSLIQSHNQTVGGSLLDVACGTGAYLVQLRSHYDVEGVDLEPCMLAVARQKLPDVPLHRADLVNFELTRQFTAVICLGSSIGYAETLPRLQQALRTFARHTAPGGIVIVEPWFSPAEWESGRLTADLLDRPDLKVARVLVSGRDGQISTLVIHHLVARPERVEHFTEQHRLGLFRHEDYLQAFREAGLDVTHDPEGLLGRGLYIGVRSLDR